MNKRINIILPETTVAILDHVTANGSRSRLIDQAIRQFVRKQSRNNLREKLKQEALVNADRDLAMSADHDRARRKPDSQAVGSDR